MFQPVRGTHDLLPDECRRHRYITSLAKKLALFYGFEEIATPIFEFNGVFNRLGDTSDVVSKEMYTFEDKGGERISLRPEGTAAVVRAVISNGLTQNLPLKFFYSGPMFRYDRPQKGRQRQFHQIGVELLGVPHFQADVECIALAAHMLDSLDIKAQLKINTLGDAESRQAYKNALVDFLTPYTRDLSEDSQIRLSKNPLRILDSKDAKDRKIVEEAPLYSAYLTDASKMFFDQVLAHLTHLKIPYHIDVRLVRGLDYYCHTAFAFASEELGSQGEILGGGRYDGLMKNMGGPEVAGIGWAAGIERLALLTPLAIPTDPLVAFIPIGEEATWKAWTLVTEWRREGLRIELLAEGAMSKRFKRADRMHASFVLICGEEELAKSGIMIRDLGTGEQKFVPFTEALGYLKESLKF